jgi:hypothetical protein
MSKASDDFEKKIERIHALIEQEGSEIIWNERIPDPDNPKQKRQIDITIRRGGKTTFIECRLHKEPQDVKWIEELMGRRISLNADAIIAVSSSGFTQGAILKADKYGVFLKDLQKLTDEDTKTWGHSTLVHLNYYKYESVSLHIYVKSLPEKDLDLDPEHIIQQIQNKGIISELFEHFKKSMNKEKVLDKLTDNSCGCTFTFNTFETQFDNFKIERIITDIEVSKLVIDHNSPSVMFYSSPSQKENDKHAHVETFELGEFEIIQHNDSAYSTIDFSAITNPQNCQFQSVGFDFKRPVNLKIGKLIGINNHQMELDMTRVDVVVECCTE